jgi:hypothetical protein
VVKIMQASWDTLLLPAGSRYAALFSGWWEDHCVKDAEGHVHLDHDPKLVRMILNYLGIKHIADPIDPLNPLVIPTEKRIDWLCLLKYYRLAVFFVRHSTPPQLSNLMVMQPHGSHVWTPCVGERLELTYANETLALYLVVCSTCLGAGMQASWEMTINKLQSSPCLYLGLIRTTQVALNNSCHDPTSFGWASSSQVYVTGQKINHLLMAGPGSRKVSVCILFSKKEN